MSPSLQSTRASRVLPLFWLGAAALTLGCGESGPPDPAHRWPSGALVAGEASAFVRVLGAAQELGESSVARHARALHEKLVAAECERFVWHAPASGASERSASNRVTEPVAALDALRCLAPGELPPAPLASLLDDRAAALVVSYHPAESASAEPLVLATAEVDSLGGVQLDLELSLAQAGLASLLLPGSEPPAAAQLSTEELLLHARLRPEGGIDLAALTAAGGQGDQMFSLRHRLFSRAVLGGTWELAAYLPRKAGLGGAASAIAGLAIAVELANRDVAALALDAFVSELQKTWPIHRSALDVTVLPTPWRDAFEAACFLDLQILPELAPCWAARPGALVVAWNRETLLHALGTSRDTDSAAGPAHGAVAHLDRFKEADERLRSALAPAAPPIPLRYPWQRLRIEARPRSATDRLKAGRGLQLVLEAASTQVTAVAP